MTLKRITVDKNYATTLLNPSPITLVTSEFEEKKNIVTISWVSPVSFSPTCVAIMLSKGTYTQSLIENSRQFAINIPGIELMKEIILCGSVSGNERDKFLETGLTMMPAIVIETPLINECFAHIECRLNQSIAVGDHTIYCGNVVSVFVREGLFDKEGKWMLEVGRPVIHLGQDQYVTLDEIAKNR
ncbi:MAG: flavin reductase family protein [Candidatus Omnitrophica bacterium]|nr:flavin reductase family protein [Candidatus Omnitrophota bacterium]